ncbi:MAG: DUF1853 family protein [Cocleimonas sp.]
MNRFTHRLIRDLAWVIVSPPLVSGNFNDTHWWNHADCLSEFEDCLPTLLALDKDPSPLIKHFEQLKSGRLGLRFEHFIAYWIIISPNYELITQNLQIIMPIEDPHKKGNHTHGELDFIIRDTRTDKTIHLEVAVKFYLGTLPYDDPYRWFGTNTSDQLGKKFDHLKQHQTQLGEKFSPYLKERGHTIDERQCFLKGRLFYPVGSDKPPENVTENHLRGRWIQSPNKNTSGFVNALDKKDWLATLNNNDCLTREFQRGFSNDDKAQCYVHLNDDHEEIGRVFHLPEGFSFPE